MVTFRHVLCPLDFSESSLRALDYAVMVARRFEAALTVLHAAPTFDPLTTRTGPLADDFRIVNLPTREDVVTELARVAHDAGADAERLTTVAEAGQTVPTILDHALARNADLLVMGTHGRSGFERFLLGSVTEKLLRKSPCPVLTVPPHVERAAPPRGGFARVLCPTDFSAAASQALGFALELARDPGGAVTVLHVIEFLAEHEARATVHFNVEEFRRALVEDAHERLRKVIAEASVRGRTVHDVVSIGRAYTEVLRLGEDHDLIVMGAQGRSGLALSLFGSTTQYVVRAATCPVLTVRAAGVDAQET
jgi:nucleotide-binding universal stress UspA family protein